MESIPHSIRLAYFTGQLSAFASRSPSTSRSAFQLSAFQLSALKKRGPWSVVRGLATIVLALALLGTNAQAAINTWDGGSTGPGDNNWSTAANWDLDTAPANDGTAALHFAGATRLAPIMNASYNINSLTFDIGAGAFIITNAPSTILTVQSGGIANNSTTLQSINITNIALGASQTWNAAAGNLSFGGTTLNLGSSQTLTIDGGNNTSIANNITGTGSGITKNGAGTVTLSGTISSFTGAVTLNAGTLRAVGDKDALGAGTLTLAGGTLELAHTAALIFGRDTTVTGNATITTDRTAAGAGVTHTLGTLAIGGQTLTVNEASATSGNQGLTFGAVTVSGGAPTFLVNNNGGGATTLLTLGAIVNGGNLLTFDGTGNTVASGIISGVGGLTKNGAGTLTFSAANTYSGDTTISAGKIVLDADNQIPNGIGKGNVIVNGTLDLVASADTINGLSGSGTVTHNSTTDTLTVGDNGATADFSGVIASSGGALNVTKIGSGTQTFSGSSANTYSGTTAVNDGRLELNKSAVNAFAGSLVIGDGTGAANSAELRITQASQQMPTGTAISINADGLFALNGNNQTIGTLSMKAGSVTTGAGILTLGGNVTSTADAASATISGNLDLGGATRTFTVADGGAASDLTVSSIIQNGGLAKASTGTLTLSGANTYSGVTTISAGVLSISSLADGLATSGIGASANSAANLVLNGGTLQYTGGTVGIDRLFSVGTTAGSSLDASGAGALTLNNTGTMGFNSQTGTRTLTLTGTNTAANTLAAAIGDNTGATSLTKSGVGTWVLSGANTYTGITTVSGGTLSISSEGNLGSNPGSFAATQLTLNGGTLQTTATFSIDDSNRGVTLGGSDGTVNVNSGTTLTIANVITGAGKLTKSGSGTLTLSAVNTYTDTTTVSAGIIKLQNNSALGTTFATSVSSGAAIHIEGSGLAIAEPISSLDGDGGGSGALRNLANNNTWSGTIAIENSGARINSDGGLLTLSGAISENGTATKFLTIGGAGNVTISSAIGGAGQLGLTKDSSGTLTLSGSAGNTYAALTTINEGTLVLNKTAGVDAVAGALIIGNGVNAATNRLAAANQINDAATVAINDSGVFDLNGNSETIASLAGSAGGSVTLGSATLTLNGAASTVYAGTISGTGGGLTKTTAATGTLTLSGANTYTGPTTINGGTVSINSIGNVGGGASALGNPSSVANGTIKLGGSTTAATLQYTGAATSSDRVIDLAGTTGGATLDASGSGALTFTSAFTATGAGAKTLMLTGSNTAANTISGAIVNSSGTTTLTKSGIGTWVLSGANTYTGITTVSGGTLSISSEGNLGSNPGSFAATQLTLNGGTLQATGSFSIDDSNRGVTMGVSGGTFNVNSGTTLTIANAIAGTGDLTKTGAGTLTLTGTDTYSGETIISVGVLRIANSAGLGAVSGNTIVSDGAALELSSGITIASGEQLNLSGSGISTGGALRNVSGNNTYTAAIVLDGTTRINSDSGALLTLSGGITGSGLGLTVGGAGDTTIQTTGISTSTGGTLTKDGGGTLTITIGSSYTGATAINEGVVNIRNNTALGTVAGTVTVSSGAALQVQGAVVGAKPLTLNGTGIANDGALRAISGANTWGGLITLGSASRINSDSGTLTLHVASGNAISGAFNVTFGGAGNVTVSDPISISTGSLMKDGAGTLTLSVANTYSGGTTISRGNVFWNANTALGSSGVTLNDGNTGADDTALFSNGAGTLANNITVANQGSGTATIGSDVSAGSGINYSGTVTLNKSANLKAGVNGTGSTVNFDGDITGSGGVTITGGGTVGFRTVAKTYTGDTRISAGTLTLAVSAAIQNSTLDMNSGDAGSLSFGSLTAATFGGLKGSRNLSLQNTTPAAVALSVGNNSTDTSYSGILSGSGSVTKIGTGTLTLSGANTYAGTTTVSAGKIKVQSSTALGATGAGSATTVAGGAAIQIEGTGLMIGENITINGDGGATAALENLLGLNTESGNIVFGGGDARINSTALGSTLTLTNGAISASGNAMTYGGAGNINISSIISGTGSSLTYDGGGTLTLSGANSYDGTTAVKSGALVVGANASGVAGNGALGNATSAVLVGDTIGSSAASLLIGGAFTVGRNITVQSGSLGTSTLGGSTDNNSTFSGLVTLNKDLTITQIATTGGNALTVSGGITAGTAGTKIVTFNNVGTVRVSTTALTDGSGQLALVKQNTGTLELNVASTYSGGTTLTGGTIKLGANNALGNSASVFAFAGGILNANNHSATLGALSLTADSTLDLLATGGVNATLTFTGDATWTGSGILTINNWTGSDHSAGTDDRIFVTGTATSDFLDHVTFTGFGFAPGAIQLGGPGGEIVPVPEPINVALGIFGAVVVMFGIGRRLLKKEKSCPVK